MKDLAKSAGLPRDLVRKIDPDMNAKQERKIATKINNSSYAKTNNIQVSTGNTKNGPKTTVGSGQRVSTSGTKAGQGATKAKVNEPPKASNKNNTSSSNKTSSSSSSKSSGNKSSSPQKNNPPPKKADPPKKSSSNNNNNNKKKKKKWCECTF